MDSGWGLLFCGCDVAISNGRHTDDALCGLGTWALSDRPKVKLGHYPVFALLDKARTWKGTGTTTMARDVFATGAIIVVTSLGVLTAMTAQAQVCSTTCSRYEEGQCVEHMQTCSTPSAPAHNFGAIAYSRKSGAWGNSFAWDTRTKAENVAMKNCAQHAKDCEVTVWFDRKCGAVAADAGPTAFWGIGETVNQARAAAQNECTKGGRKGCTVQVSQCSR